MREYDHFFLGPNDASLPRKIPAPRGSRKKPVIPARDPHVKSLQEQADTIFEDHNGQNGDHLPLELELHPDYSARKKQVHTTLQRLGLKLDHMADDQHVLVWTTPETRDLLTKKLTTYAKDTNREKLTFAPIRKLQRWPEEKRITPSLRSRLSNPDFLSASVTMRLASQASQQIITETIDAVKKEQPSAHYSDSAGVRIIEAVLSPQQIQRLIDTQNAILVVEDQQAYHPMLTGEALGTCEPRLVSVVPTDAPAVCIFDTGIDPHPYLQGTIEAADHADFLHSSEDEDGHGTFVAGLIVYGTGIRDAINATVLQPDTRVISIRVFSSSMPQPRGDQLFQAIRTGVQKHKDRTRIFNLSFQGDQPYRTNGEMAVATPLAVGLDRLAREEDVLFVVAAGNVAASLLEHLDDEFPLTHRSPLCGIRSPAEAVNVLSVGATIPDTDERSVVGFAEGPSPCSTAGPGIAGATKPEVLSVGGGYCLEEYRLLSQPGSSVFSLRPVAMGATGYSVGTSYAAPLVSRLAAKLWTQYPGATANLIRAIIIHTARPVSPLLSNSEYDLLWDRLSGFGLPDEAEALASARNRMCYLFQGILDAGKQQDVKFYVPDAFPSCARKAPGRALRMTLVYDPPVYPESEVFYCKLSLSASLHIPSGRKQPIVQPHFRRGDDDHNIKSYAYVIPPTARANQPWTVRVRCKPRHGIPLFAGEQRQRFALVVELFDPTDYMSLYHSCLSYYLEQVA